MLSRTPWMLMTSLLVWACCASQANAHLVSSGLGPFYDGVVHVVATPEDVLATIALALLAGQGGKRHGRAMLFALPAAWQAGALFASSQAVYNGSPVVSAACLIVLGALVAANRRLPSALVLSLALTSGLFLGFNNGVAATGVWPRSLTVMGIGAAVFVIVAIVAGQVVAAKKEWTQIAIRVAGSWVCAIGMLMLGWSLR